MPSHTIHVERDGKAAAMLKAYLSNRVGIGTDVREEMKALDTCNMTMIRIPTFQAASLSPMSGFSSVAVLVGDYDADNVLSIRYVHVRDKHQGKGHGAALVQELLQRRFTLHVDMTSEDFLNTFEFWISQGFRIVFDHSTQSSYRLTLEPQNLPPHPRNYLVSLKDILEESPHRSSLEAMIHKVSEVLATCYPTTTTVSEPQLPAVKEIRAPNEQASKPVATTSPTESKFKKRSREKEVSPPSSAKRPVGRTPKSKTTGEPMVWVDGKWQEACGLFEPGPVRSKGGPGSKVAKCSKGQGPHAAMQVKKKKQVLMKQGPASQPPPAHIPVIQEELDEIDMDEETATWDARIATAKIFASERKAFFLYCNTKRAKVVAELSEADNATISTTLAEKWGNISDERRNKYLEKANAMGEGGCPMLSLQMYYLKAEAEAPRTISAAINHAQLSSSVSQPSHATEAREQEMAVETVAETTFPSDVEKTDLSDPDPSIFLDDKCDAPQNKATFPFAIQCYKTCYMKGVVYNRGEAIYTSHPHDKKGEDRSVGIIDYFCSDLQSGMEFAVVRDTARPQDLPSYPFSHAPQELVLDASCKTRLVPLRCILGRCILIRHDPDIDMDSSILPDDSFFYQTTYRWDAASEEFVYQRSEVEADAID